MIGEGYNAPFPQRKPFDSPRRSVRDWLKGGGKLTDNSPWCRSRIRSLRFHRSPVYTSLMFEHRCTVSARARLRKLFQTQKATSCALGVWRRGYGPHIYPSVLPVLRRLLSTQVRRRSRYLYLPTRLTHVCRNNNIRSHEDAYRAFHSRTMLESEGLDFGLFVSEFEMVLPGSIEL